MANQAKTINQKGDLMSYRPDIKLLDATIRDGGLVNNFLRSFLTSRGLASGSSATRRISELSLVRMTAL